MEAFEHEFPDIVADVVFVVIGDGAVGIGFEPVSEIFFDSLTYYRSIVEAGIVFGVAEGCFFEIEGVVVEVKGDEFFIKDDAIVFKEVGFFEFDFLNKSLAPGVCFWVGCFSEELVD